MAKRSKTAPNKAKSIIAQPLFRCRQERPEKGKGSYRREAFQSKSWEASCFMAPPKALLKAPPKAPLQALYLVIAKAA